MAKDTKGIQGPLLQTNIKFIREHKRITYKEFAAEINVSEGQAKTYELRGITPPLEVLCSIADFAGVSVDALIREKLSASNITQLKEPLINFDKQYQLQVRLGFVIKLLLNQRAFGKYTGIELQKALSISKGQYDKLMAGDNIPVTVETMVRFIELFNVNANWWLTGQGQMFNHVDLVQAIHKIKARLDKLEQ